MQLTFKNELVKWALLMFLGDYPREINEISSNNKGVCVMAEPDLQL